MAVTLEALGIDRMSVEERIELIELIQDSLPERARPADIPEAHKQILAERLAAADADPDGGRPWREVLAEIEAEQ